MIGSVELDSFIFELYEHVRSRIANHWLDPVANRGCSIEWLNDHPVRIVCPNPHSAAFAGWMLFQSAVSRYGQVVDVTGEAEMDANAYKNPPTKHKTRKI